MLHFYTFLLSSSHPLISHSTWTWLALSREQLWINEHPGITRANNGPICFSTFHSAIIRFCTLRSPVQDQSWRYELLILAIWTYALMAALHIPFTFFWARSLKDSYVYVANSCRLCIFYSCRVCTYVVRSALLCRLTWLLHALSQSWVRTYVEQTLFGLLIPSHM